MTRNPIPKKEKQEKKCGAALEFSKFNPLRIMQLSPINTFTLLQPYIFLTIGFC